MHKDDPTILTDRISLSLRWMVLVTLALLLSWGQNVRIGTILLLTLAGLWNLVLSIINMTRNRLWQHPTLVTLVDVLLAILFTLLPAVGNDPFLWAGLLPAFSGAFYFGLVPGLIITILLLVLDAAGVSFLAGATAMLSTLLLPALVMLAVAIAAGIIGQQVKNFLMFQAEIADDEQKSVEEAERDRIKALYRIISELTATLNFQRVLEMALDLTTEVLNEPGKENVLVGAFFLFAGDELEVGSARRFTPSDMRTRLPAQEGVIIETINSGRPRRVAQPAEDPELRRIVALRSCGVVYCYPLRSLEEIYGVLLFGHPDPSYFNTARQEILEIVGRQSLVALQNARLYRELEQEKERMMEIQEEARKQLARNLHDGPTQSVAAIAMRVNFARRLLDRDQRAAGDELFKVEDLARRTTKEIRHMLFTLRPLVLETGGLIAAFESMAEKMQDTYGQRVTIQATEEAVDDLEMGKQGVVFYIAEEAVNNARKHAEAENITIRLEKVQEDVILLEIEDNGVGFNVGEVDAGYEKRGSLGMVNMRERTELVNGVIQLSSKVGEGTRIRVWIPLNDDAAERIRRGKLQ